MDFKNEKPVNVWPLKVNELNMVVDYTYDEAGNIYQVVKEILNMQVKAFGETVPIKDTYEYSNYRKL